MKSLGDNEIVVAIWAAGSAFICGLRPGVRIREMNNLAAAKVVMLQRDMDVTSEFEKQILRYIDERFSETPPACAKGLPLPTGYRFLFRFSNAPPT